MLPDKIYNVLKWISATAIAPICVFLRVVLPIFNVSTEVTSDVVTVLTAVGTLIAALLGISVANYNKAYSDIEHTEGTDGGEC